MTIEEIAYSLAQAAALEASDGSPDHPDGQARPEAHLDYECHFLGMALMKFVNYAIFNAWVAWRLDRSQRGDDLDGSASPHAHTLH